MNKFKSELRSIVTFVKAHPLAALVLLFVGGMFLTPLLFQAWNKGREKLPANVQRMLPVAGPKVGGSAAV